MKKILDPCCGARKFWFNKNHESVIYGDIRKEEHYLSDGRLLKIDPDMVLDFRNLPFENDSFKLVVFDPPHLVSAGINSNVGRSYGILDRNWRESIKAGFEECMRVLQRDGILIFKWNEIQIKTSEIIQAIGEQPLFGHVSGRQSKTHWMTFMKN